LFGSGQGEIREQKKWEKIVRRWKNNSKRIATGKKGGDVFTVTNNSM
jgi:hypothetical protein